MRARRLAAWIPPARTVNAASHTGTEREHIELFTQAHYRESIEPDSALSPLFKDVFVFHWQEESQHAIMDELE